MDWRLKIPQRLFFANRRSCPTKLKTWHLRLDVPLLHLKSGCHKFEVEHEFWQATVGWGSKNHAPSEVGFHSCYQWDMPNYWNSVVSNRSIGNMVIVQWCSMISISKCNSKSVCCNGYGWTWYWTPKLIKLHMSKCHVLNHIPWHWWYMSRDPPFQPYLYHFIPPKVETLQKPCFSRRWIHIFGTIEWWCLMGLAIRSS